MVHFRKKQSFQMTNLFEKCFFNNPGFYKPTHDPIIVHLKLSFSWKCVSHYKNLSNLKFFTIFDNCFDKIL